MPTGPASMLEGLAPAALIDGVPTAPAAMLERMNSERMSNGGENDNVGRHPAYVSTIPRLNRRSYHRRDGSYFRDESSPASSTAPSMYGVKEAADEDMKIEEVEVVNEVVEVAKVEEVVMVEEKEEIAASVAPLVEVEAVVEVIQEAGEDEKAAEITAPIAESVQAVLEREVEVEAVIPTAMEKIEVEAVAPVTAKEVEPEIITPAIVEEVEAIIPAVVEEFAVETDVLVAVEDVQGPIAEVIQDAVVTAEIIVPEELKSEAHEIARTIEKPPFVLPTKEEAPFVPPVQEEESPIVQEEEIATIIVEEAIAKVEETSIVPTILPSIQVVAEEASFKEVKFDAELATKDIPEVEPVVVEAILPQVPLRLSEMKMKKKEEDGDSIVSIQIEDGVVIVPMDIPVPESWTLAKKGGKDALATQESTAVVANGLKSVKIEEA